MTTISLKDINPTILKAIPLIAIVESQNNPNAIGDNGRSLGMYQISKAYVKDVNRILGSEVFTWEDAFDMYKATKIVCVYLTHYASAKRLGHSPTLEEIVRIHNGGPNGYRRESTDNYWKKIKVTMEMLNDYRK